MFSSFASSSVQNSDKTPLLTVLLSGDIGCGKTSVALETALSCDFPFVKLINPAMLVAYQENVRCEKIAKVFEDAHRSPLSVVVGKKNTKERDLTKRKKKKKGC